MNRDAGDVDSRASELDEAAAAIRSALASDGDADLGDLLDPSVTWGDCTGAGAVLDFVNTMASTDVAVHDLDVEVAGDRIVTQFRIGDGGQALTQAIFVRNGRICEIVDAADRDDALDIRPVGDLAAAAARPWRASRTSPVLPVSDLTRAVDHYRALGFEVHVYEGGAAYAFAARNDTELHLTQVTNLDPATNTGACYLYVDDADALYASWRLAEVAGRLIAPVHTEYGLREGAHVDPDGNLLRFGSGI